MSHCSGGCGGEDPLMKKTKAENLVIENQATENQATENQATENQATENQQVESKKAEGQASKKTEAESVKGSTKGTWRPSGQ